MKFMPRVLPSFVGALLGLGLAACDGQRAVANDDTAGTADPAVVVDPAVAYANAQVEAGAPYREGYFEYEGVTLHYVEAGQGDLIVFYHGFPSFWFSFYDQMEAFRGDYHVVAVDGLGAGLSDKPDDLGLYRAEALAAHLDALAQHLAADQKFTLVGHDWGGALAMAYAESHPERLNAVASFNAPSVNVFLDLLRHDEQQQKTSTYMAVMAATPQQTVVANPPGERIWTESYGGLLSRGELTQTEYDLFGQALRPAAASNGGYNWYRANVPLPADISDEDFWPNPPREISVPALLVWGTEDRAFVPSFIDRMHETIPDLEVEVFEGANHWTTMSHPDLSNEAIARLLARRSD
nr:alpha/beta hydrolase [Hyphomonas sp. Mor2]